MLKALELVGFKSFADKTRFDFPPGITVVVGPNGSGKSNIVDAIKWVLGEQSAKSLRGKEMADVIFKGTSGPGGRRPAGAAEANILIDNTKRHFDSDEDEIRVGRRVYRSGESEYLINGAPCRLKDIRNLFRGTGVGTDAYSLIEQGKVERMLQASPKDRRAIFEEAAGISRFNAKKVEAQRRLARVEQHLIRLADIVEEVGTRYRSIKSQASKAARYRECTGRLKELRTFVGAADWRDFRESLDKIEQEKQIQDQLVQQEQKAIDDRDDENRQLEQQLELLNRRYDEKQESASTMRERIANLQSESKNHTEKLADFDVRVARYRETLESTDLRLNPLQQNQSQLKRSMDEAIQSRDSLENSLQRQKQEIELFEGKLADLKSQSESRNRENAERIALCAELEKQLSVARTELKTAEKDRARLDQAGEILQSQQVQLAGERDEAEQKIQHLNDLADSKDSALATAREALVRERNRLNDCRELLADLNSRLVAARQKKELIEELENSQEGIQAGPRGLLQLSKSDPQPPYTEICGLVADLIQVNVQHASIVDTALGHYAQYVVVDGDLLIRAIADDRIRLPGRVGVLMLARPEPIGNPDLEELAGVTGVVGPLSELVQTEPRYEGFVRKLLQGTWLVKKLSDALHLQSTRESRARFVSLDGEVLEPDGKLVAGPQNLATGIVSRRSELRALSRGIDQLNSQVLETEPELVQRQAGVEKQEASLQGLLDEHTETAGSIREQQAVLTGLDKQFEQNEQSMDQLRQDREQVNRKIVSCEDQILKDEQHLANNQLEIEQTNLLLDEFARESNEFRQKRNNCEQAMTADRVELARLSQKVEQLVSEQNSAEIQCEDLVKSRLQNRSELAAILWGIRQSRRITQTSNQELEALQKQRIEVEENLQAVARERENLENRRRSFRQELETHRSKLQAATEAAHRLSLEQEKLLVNQEQLRQRLLDDYGIEVAELTVEPDQLSEEENLQREEIDQEIRELRKKISDMGAVNMDALKELEQTESRYNEMHGQYTDLVEAKEELEKIIQRINQDSRRLFSETLDAIRTNFQQLFRQTFGGGRADIVLEEGVDILEAGIEIVATPPGKPQFNNSLLSGGEKALTAVSLLMAIFKFRPSPFCVLDEVDAPFDEANIGRFIDVLKSFLGWTKFVIVTHSKKTMTAATTLYGVTMQESGVSKRVSVRFEEVGESGEIASSAVERTIREEDQGAA